MRKKTLNIQDRIAFAVLNALLDNRGFRYLSCRDIRCKDCRKFGIINSMRDCRQLSDLQLEQWLLTNGYIEEILQ